MAVPSKNRYSPRENPPRARAQGVWEKEITLHIARELRSFLRRANYDVALTRDADTYVSLRQRAQFANQERADLFVSIHVNSVPSQECHAVETYYLGAPDDPRAEQLAGKENRESGYHLADFRRLLEGVYVHVRQAESRKLAEVVHYLDVGGLPVSDAPGLGTLLAGARQRSRDDDHLLKQAIALFDLLYAAYMEGESR